MAELATQNHLQNHLYDDLTTDDYLDLLTNTNGNRGKTNALNAW